MAYNNDAKLKSLLHDHREGTLLLASWLEKRGISRSLQAHYRRSGWLESVGTGAFKRPGESVSWQGAMFALQQHARLPLHPGAMTALSLQGYSQYLRFAGQPVYLFSPRGVKIPAWFKNHDWQAPVRHLPTTLLPPDLGLVNHPQGNFSIRISAPERAMIECLDHAPKYFDLVECLQVMEGLTNLRPDVVADLLAACTSIKAKRLFLFMADRANHSWLPFVDTSRINLGKGDRSFAKGGSYVGKYRIIVPQELVVQ